MSDRSPNEIVVALELARAEEKFPPFNSPHEGWAVIKEEVDELWDLVKQNRGQSFDAYNEAAQVAAMALRYMKDSARPAVGTTQTRRNAQREER